MIRLGTFSLFISLGSLLHAMPKVLPVLNQAIDDITVQANAASTNFDLDTIFGTEEIDDNVVRFTSQASNGSRVIDFALFSNRTPLTRTNFLQYVNDGDYNHSFIHRSVPGFVIQGGGFLNTTPGAGLAVNNVPTDPPVNNEFGISNTSDTVSMAKTGGNPDSATSQWFVNLGDNSANLDNQNGGFTVFARVTKGTRNNAMDFGNPTLFPPTNLTGGNPASPFSAVPLIAGFTGGAVGETDLVLFPTVSLAPLPVGEAGESTALTYSIPTNTNPAITTNIDPSNNLQINYTHNSWGRGLLTIRATDSVGNIVEDNIDTEVLRTYAAWRSASFSLEDVANDTISGPSVDNGKALSNLELYIHGLTLADRDNDVVVFSNTRQSNSDFPTFSFPLFNLLSGVTFAIQTSSDLGITDSWDTVPHTVIGQTRNGDIDSMVIRTTSPRTSPAAYYRIVFTLTN